MAQFSWRVAKRGYRWSEGQSSIDEFSGQPRLYLEPVIYAYRKYHPFDIPGLFRIFADLKPQLEPMLQFADEYGHLGTHFAEPEDELEPGEEVKTDAQRRQWEEEIIQDRIVWDPLHHWQNAIKEMRSCVKLWSQVQKGTAKKTDESRLVAGVNRAIQAHACHVQLESSISSPSGYRLTYFPRNLLGAMWIQFAQALAENQDFRECEACERWFQVTRGKNRKSRIHCSDACKSKSYRSRQEKARGMFAAGKTIQQIADVIGSEHHTVERWVHCK
ncbi:hypothetical protein C5Y96_03160 [Blastopirellula marina]|uniref:Uncharacterized protein n=1 Tax=Blastopirellula marina TaxID=124 RepID=A0A2S8G357_9BACT|nr:MULTISPECIES: hypothetical protein [Pirellulaceae]PQO38885.1 hypothetical protein C5Y96_03160 [Blastopirellula marina]RCS55193.1 hypothetical protein DTL36_03165 [Bremerella cremea]